MPKTEDKRTILILAANPRDTDALRLGEEVREIQECLKLARQRNDFEVKSVHAVRIKDLRRALLDHEPTIVHFSGHGEGADGLLLEDAVGKAQYVSSASLAGLFELFPDVECVLLNACYSMAQADAIVQHVGHVVGMRWAIGDGAAKQFSMGFYDGLGSGRDYAEAFKFGVNGIDLEGLPEAATPVLRVQDPDGSVTTPHEEDAGRDMASPCPAEAGAAAEPAATEDSPAIYLETPEGQVPLSSPFYVERPPIEKDCFEEIRKPGALIRVKAPRQMGKTSLMSRILAEAQRQEPVCRAVSLSFQEADGEVFAKLDLFLQWFCASIADALGLEDELERRWKGVVGSKQKCSKYFQNYLLPAVEGSLVLGLDEVDQVFNYDAVATDFFGLLRAWHERAKNEPLWQRLKLVIVHSKEVYVPLEINQSPFNVGLPVELPELTLAQVQDLAERHGLALETEAKQLMGMIGGHPYLVRVALYQLARGRTTLAELVTQAPTEAGPFSDHLRRHLLNLEEHDELLGAMQQLLKSKVPVQIGSAEMFKLRSMGLVKLEGNAAEPLCDLYRQYFGCRWGMGA